MCRLLFLLLLCVCALPLLAQQKPIATFTIKDVFGVSHPVQIIDFDLKVKVDPKGMRVLGADGAEVPYQVLSGNKLAIQTGLPANTELSWSLVRGKPQAVQQGALVVKKEADWYEITNNLTGVRIPLPVKNPANTPAPIQGIRLRDGQWTGTGPNVLSRVAKAMTVRFLEQGPLKVVVEVAYQFDEKAYTSTIMLEANQPSILVEEDATTAVSYFCNVYAGLKPTEAMYRGHHASAVENGRGADGTRFNGFGSPHEVGYVDVTYGKAHDYPRIAVWNPWIVDSGWWWQMYDARGGEKSNLLGLYAGRTSRALGARYSGVNVSTAPGQEPATRIVMTVNPGEGDRAFPRTRYQWGIFTGVKGEDLKGPKEIQPINVQMNIHAGINLNKLYRLQLDFPAPRQGFGSPFMTRTTVDEMIKTLREDKEGAYGKGLYGYLFNAETSSRELISMWADPSGEKLRAAVASMSALAKEMLDDYVNRDGVYNFQYHYWMGGLNMMRKGVWGDSILADPLASPEDKAKVKAVMVLYGSILWDDDFVPLQVGSGIHLGTENMPVQEQGYRTYYALLLSAHPAMRERVKLVQEETLNEVRHIVNEYGAEMGCVHYIGASFEPTLNALLQIKQLGQTDPFKTEPRLAKFADFYMNFQTPPEIRFGSERKNISTGDGPTESSEMFGQMATGLRNVDPDLSARLMWSWNRGGKPHSGFFATTLLMIDEKAPEKDPQLGNANFPGYYSVLRHGWNTPNETALWFLNGDFYRDHRHNDRGGVIMYALGCPLSLDWGSQYAPHVPGGFMHSTVLPESMTGYQWDKSDVPLQAGGMWGSSALESYQSFRTCATSRGRFTSGGTTWTRTVTSIHPNETYPILLFRDTFAGEQAGASKIFTLNLMAEGDVDTPAGKMTPPISTYGDGYNDKIAHGLASAGKVFTLAPGLNHLGFTGVQFGTPEKPAIGIDWDLYTLADEAQQAHIGNWADNWVGGAYGAFQQVNNRPYEERQDILRMKGNGPFTVMILPYRKGAKRTDVQVTREGENVRIAAGDETTIIGPAFYAFWAKDRQVIASFDARPVQIEDLRGEGGPLEINCEGNTLTVTIHGDKGPRTLVLPAGWTLKDPKAPAVQAGGKWTVAYRGGEPLTVVWEKK